MSRAMDWRILSAQALCYAAVQTVFSANEILLLAVETRALASVLPGLLLVLFNWLANGVALAAGAQWSLRATAWRAPCQAGIVLTTAFVHGPLNAWMLHSLFHFQDGATMLPVAPHLFLFWRAAIGGGLFFGYCVFVQRSRERQRELTAARYRCTALEFSVHEERSTAGAHRIDPALLERTLDSLRRTYGVDRDGGQSLLDALVEYLRLAMPSIRASAPVHADAAVLSAWQALRRQLDAMAAAPHPADESAPSNTATEGEST